MQHPLWRVDVCVVYNCCWPSPAQLFSGPSSAGLMTKFYCLRFETSPTWRARSPYLYPPRRRWPIYTPRHWVPFSSPPTTRRATVEVFDPASTRMSRSTTMAALLYNIGTDHLENIVPNNLVHSCMRIRCRGYVLIELLQSNGCLLQSSYHYVCM
jgi:hypothetical protein